jgi:hypothetical protein
MASSSSIEVGSRECRYPKLLIQGWSIGSRTTNTKVILLCNKGTRHTMALPFTLKNILRQKKNYESSNISLCQKKKKKNLIFKKNQNPSRYYYYYYNSIITNLKFQHKPKISSFKNPHIKNRLITKGPKSLKLLYYMG